MSTLDAYRKNVPGFSNKARTGNVSATAQNFFKEDATEQPDDLSIYSDVSDVAEKKTIDQIITISHGLKNQDSKVQMTNWVSFVESLSRPFLNKKHPEHQKGRCLGTWAYSGPGFENEVIGKIEKDGIVHIKHSTYNEQQKNSYIITGNKALKVNKKIYRHFYYNIYWY